MSLLISGSPNAEIRRAAKLASCLEDICVLNVQPSPQGTAFDIHLLVNTHLPSRRAAIGQSADGVWKFEPVILRLPVDYPEGRPWFFLRKNFPDVQFHFTAASARFPYPRPCLTTEPFAQFYAEHGLGPCLGQLLNWLKKAGRGTLVNANDGWEPSHIVSPAFLVGGLQPPTAALSSINEQPSIEKFEYVESDESGSNIKTVISFVQDEKPTIGSKQRLGVGLHLVAGCGLKASGEVLGDTEAIRIDELDNFASRIGYGDKVVSEALLVHAANEPSVGTQNIPIVLDVVRPFNVTGTGEPLERYYLMAAVDFSVPLERMVENIGSYGCKFGTHLGSISKDIRQSLSGNSQSITFGVVGAGSLGSVLTDSLVRAGWTCDLISDTKVLAPHNLVRHALHWSPDTFHGKREMLSMMLKDIQGDYAFPAGDITSFDSLGYTTGKLIINTTASKAVQRHLSKIPSDSRGRIADTKLFLGGRAGLLVLEGAQANPSVQDAEAHLHCLMVQADGVGEALLSAGSGLEDVALGFGCGTTTMVMSQPRLNLMAGCVGLELLKLGEERGLNADQGHVFLAYEDRNGDMRALSERLEAFTVVPCSNAAWNVRISPGIVELMDQRRMQAGKNETGGHLIGLIRHEAREVIVVQALEAPTDSEASPIHFKLGTEGIRKRISEIYVGSGGMLTCVGTWHSHTQDTPPSSVDESLVDELSNINERVDPSIMLVLTPRRFHAMLADPVDATNA